MASGPVTSWEIDGETVETVSHFILGGSKITADGDCSHEIKRCLLLGRKVMTNLYCSTVSFSHVPLCATPWTAAHQAPPSLGFSRQEHWSGVPLPSPNMLSRLVITFLPRIKYLLISWLQSPSAVILEPKKIKPDTVCPSICHEVMGLDAMILVFWMLSFKPTFYSPLSLSSRGSLDRKSTRLNSSHLN